MTDTPAKQRLHVLQAIEDGWNAFAKAPWSFLLFQALVAVIALPFAALAAACSARIASVPGIPEIHPVGAGMLLVVGLVGYIIVMLWGVVGIIRGAWQCLEGVKPDFKTFIRWDGEATGRLFIRGIEFLVLLAVISLNCSLVGFGLVQINQALAIIPVVVALVFFIYLSINQKFLPFIALLQTNGSFEAIQKGRTIVDPSWWTVLWFFIVEAIINAIAAAFQYGGLFVVVPVLICISTAAYRQLFGSEDQTGLTANTEEQETGNTEQSHQKLCKPADQQTCHNRQSHHRPLAQRSRPPQIAGWPCCKPNFNQRRSQPRSEQSAKQRPTKGKCRQQTQHSDKQTQAGARRRPATGLQTSRRQAQSQQISKQTQPEQDQGQHKLRPCLIPSNSSKPDDSTHGQPDQTWKKRQQSAWNRQELNQQSNPPEPIGNPGPAHDSGLAPAGRRRAILILALRLRGLFCCSASSALKGFRVTRWRRSSLRKAVFTRRSSSE